jgi:hypothetical protein
VRLDGTPQQRQAKARPLVGRVFWVIALAFTARMDRVLAGAAEPVHPAEFDGMESSIGALLL